MKMNKYAQPFNTKFFIYNKTRTDKSEPSDNSSDCDGNVGKGITTVPDSVFIKECPKEWNYKRTCRWLQKNTYDGTHHGCATWVRTGLEKGGLNTDGRPTYAWRYEEYLPKIGFKEIVTIINGNIGSYKPEPGDIATYMKYNNPNKAGHICLYTGVQWCSDFRQNNMDVYDSTDKIHIFRFNKLI